MTDIPRGSRWQRTHGPHSRDIVLIIRTTPNNVFWKERNGDQHSQPVPVFLGQFAPLDDLEHCHRCERCGSIKLRDTDKYCRACQGLLAAVKRARENKTTAEAVIAAAATLEGCDDVLTTTDNLIIEEHLKDQPTPEPAPSASAMLRWRITGRRIIVQEQTIEVAAADVISALALVDEQSPGISVTDVHLLD